MNDIKRIDQLVEQYNSTSLQQRERLIEIYDLMQARKGGDRIVRFGNSRSWMVNSFQPLDKREWVYEKYIDGLCPLITEVKHGQ